MSRNDGERVMGRGNDFVFLGRSFPAPANIPIRRQPHTQPCCLALGSRSQSQSTAPTPHFPQSNTLPSCPHLSHPHLAHAVTYALATNCHLPHPFPILISRRLHQSQKTLMNLPSTSIGHFNTTPNFFIFLFIAF